ncbi:MAG: type II toxin-antitoxin system MqsA family antitoxin [Lachnospiraceae bacterium]|nr:type II toxin-antitoxin system MqsA family antitoxin [Lachnospiraceae bacterium]
MKCQFCNGEREKTITFYTTQINNCIIVVKNVPAYKCTQCGEIYFEHDTMSRIEVIIDKLESVISEVTVLDYGRIA